MAPAATKVPTAKCGTVVTYVDTKGHEKMAFVTGTPATVVEGTSLPTLGEGELHLTVVSPSGRNYPRHNVKFGAPAEEVEAPAIEVPAEKLELWNERIVNREYTAEEGEAYIARKSAEYVQRHTTPVKKIGYWKV